MTFNPLPVVEGTLHRYIYTFIPYLQYIASDSSQSESTTQDALETFLTIYREEKDLRELPSKWDELVRSCFQKLGAEQKADLASRFNFMQLNALKLPTTKQSTSLQEKLLEKSKRKSLAAFRTPVPNTVETEQLQAHYVSSSSVMSEMEKIDAKEILQLYQEYHAMNDSGTKDLEINRVAATNDDSRKALEDFLASPSQKFALDLCESLSNPLSLPLTPVALLRLQSSMTAGLAQDICEELCWAMIFSLEKQSKTLSDAEMKASISSSVSLLIASAAVHVNVKLTAATLSVLLCLAEAGDLELEHSDYTNITLILVRTAEDSLVAATESQSPEYRSGVVPQLTLSILCQHPDLTSSAAHTNAAVFGLLQNSPEKITRILSAKYLSFVSSNHGHRFQASELEFLAALGDDQVRDVRIHCRIAFANGLLNNKDNADLRDSMIAAYFPHMFATRPVILSAPGGPVAAEDFTHQINGPLLKLLKGAKNIPKAAKRALLKFVKSCAKVTQKDSLETRSDLRKALKLLTKSEPHLKGTVGVTEKIFLKAANEYDDEKLAVRSIACLIKSIESGLHEDYQASARLLSAISNRMIRKASSLYPQCLHVLSSIQELPQDIFNFYLLEMASFRISPEFLPEEEAFLEYYGLAVHGSTPALADLAYCIQEYYKDGAPVTIRTARSLLNCLSEQRVDEQGLLWSSFTSMASASYFFTEKQQELLFKVAPSQQACSAWIKIIENQGLPPPSAFHNLLKAVQSTMDLKEYSLQLAHCIFAATREQSSDTIGEEMISIGLSTIQAASYDQSLSRKGRMLLMRVLDTYEISDRKVRALRRSLENISDSLKTAGPLKKRPNDEAELVSYLELLLKLSRSHLQLVAWDDVNRMAAREGTLLLDSQNEDHLRKIFKIWHDTATVLNVGFDASHVFFHLLFLQFGEEPPTLIQTLCHYLTEGASSGENVTGWLAKLTTKTVTEDKFHLQMLHTHRFRVVLQQNYWACQKVLTAVKGTRKTGRHLEQLGDSIFVAWSRAQNIQVEQACEQMLRLLVKKGWRLKSEDLTDDARLLARIERNSNVTILMEHILAEGSTAPHVQCSKNDKNRKVTRREFVNGTLGPAFAHFKVQDLATKILLYQLVAVGGSDIENYLGLREQ